MSGEEEALSVLAGIVVLVALWFGLAAADQTAGAIADDRGSCTRATPQSC